jgi:hypothetical protein
MKTFSNIENLHCIVIDRHWIDHFKNDRRSDQDQDHHLKIDRRSDQNHPLKNILDQDHRSFISP